MALRANAAPPPGPGSPCAGSANSWEQQDSPRSWCTGLSCSEAGSSTLLREEAIQTGYIPLLGQDVILDDYDDVAFVIVLPKEEELGGVVDPNTIVEKPLEGCRKIFVRRRNHASASNLAWEGFGLLASGAVATGVYQSVIRNALLQILRAAGLIVNSFDSIDGDETFLTVSLDPNGQQIRQLAQRFRYHMPLKADAYKHMHSEGEDHERGKPMIDEHRRLVIAYMEYDMDHHQCFQPFRNVDIIRLSLKCMDEWVDFQELQEQGVILRCFPVAQYEQVQPLHEEWGGLHNLCRFPTHAFEDDLRDYFGESIVFFFTWFCHYVRMLVPLAVIGGLCSLRRLPALGLSLSTQRMVQLAFAFVLCFWASVFNETFCMKVKSASRRWGMKDWSRYSLERKDYNHKLEGTSRLWLQRSFADAFVWTFCGAFAAALCYLEYYTSVQREHGDTTFEQYGSYIIVSMIRIVSFVWSQLAPKIVALQNHRTEDEYNNALTWVVASVKLFVALFPFINTAFLKKFFEPTCGTGPDPLASAAWKIYGKTKIWPTGIPYEVPVKKFANGTILRTAPDALDFLMSFSFQEIGEASGNDCPYGCLPNCIHGCFPQQCVDGEACVTNCTLALEADLWTVYAVHVACTILFALIIPIGLTKLNVLREFWKVRQAPGGRDKPYSFLQVQAKCAEVAKYEYMSWGGSHCEDFLELAIGFALLTCFGIALPAMAIAGLISHIIEYRLLAYRMTNVTGRPIPYGAEGIGVWQQIFHTISEAAVIINVGMAVFAMYPMRHWLFRHQLTAFLILEHCMLFVKKLVNSIWDKEPATQRRIDDFNSRLLESVKQKADKFKPVAMPLSTGRGIDVSIGPKFAQLDAVLARLQPGSP